jgi:GntR family transcriptional regulator
MVHNLKGVNMITIDHDSAEPLFNQLILQIKKAIEDNALQPGDPLPSIRQLASELEMNPKTVAKAYRLLERDNILTSKGAKGSFVRLDAVEHLSFDIKAWLRDEIEVDIAKYREAGATDSEIRNALNQLISSTGS